MIARNVLLFLTFAPSLKSKTLKSWKHCYADYGTSSHTSVILEPS